MENRLVAERLKCIREARGITPAETAAFACLDRSTYYKYELGTAFPSGPTLRLLSLFLGTSIDYLCGKTDDPTPDLLLEPVDPDRLGIVRDISKLDNEQADVIRGILKIFLRQ